MEHLINIAAGILSRHLLSSIVFLPMVGVAFIAVIPKTKEGFAKGVALLFSLALLILCGALFMRFRGVGEFELVESAAWIPSLGINYRVGVDGTSMLMICLTALLGLVSIFASWIEIERRTRLFYALILTVMTGLNGVFASMDMFLFYVFWDAALIPMCFIIGIWGSNDSTRAAIKFLIFTMAGSVVMLVALLYAGSAAQSFDLVQWYAHSFTKVQQLWLFGGFALAFAIKVPIVGLHTWLPDAHTEAPTAGSILLAGVFLKLGTYGFFRFAMPLFPDAVAAFSPVLLTLAVAGVIGGALIAMVQLDLKRMIAYTSISHMGMVVLGLFALEKHAAAGAVLQMASHGLIIAGLFLIAGVLYARRKTRLIADYGGSARSLPIIAVVFIFMALAAAGLPGLSGFASEFILLLGSFQSRTVYAAIATVGILIMAACMVWAVQRIFFGPLKHEEERKLPDLCWHEWICALLLAVPIIIIGVWPQSVLSKTGRSAEVFVSLTKRIQMVIPASEKKTEAAPGAQDQEPGVTKVIEINGLPDR